MRKKIFVSQQMLDNMSNENKVHIEEDNRLTFLSNKLTYHLEAALKFLSCETSHKDPHKLIGKIITTSTLKEKGADLFMDSVIYKDEAYKTEQGFIGRLQEKEPVKKEKPATPEKKEEKSEEELLAEFILKKL